MSVNQQTIGHCHLVHWRFPLSLHESPLTIGIAQDSIHDMISHFWIQSNTRMYLMRSSVLFPVYPNISKYLCYIISSVNPRKYSYPREISIKIPYISLNSHILIIMFPVYLCLYPIVYPSNKMAEFSQLLGWFDPRQQDKGKRKGGGENRRCFSTHWKGTQATYIWYDYSNRFKHILNLSNLDIWPLLPWLLHLYVFE
jgi:hypothetical protein